MRRRIEIKIEAEERNQRKKENVSTEVRSSVYGGRSIMKNKEQTPLRSLRNFFATSARNIEEVKRCDERRVMSAFLGEKMNGLFICS